MSDEWPHTQLTISLGLAVWLMGEKGEKRGGGVEAVQPILIRVILLDNELARSKWRYLINSPDSATVNLVYGRRTRPS